MSEIDPDEAVDAFLRGHSLLGPGEHAGLTLLAGGVSSNLWRAELPAGAICVKGALPQLKVADPWFAPVSRNRVEYEWLEFAHAIRPQNVPRVLAYDEPAGLFAMEYLPPTRYPVWKSQLLAGQVDAQVARAVGSLVGQLHAASAADPRSPARFATDDNFDALRIGPYLRDTGRAHPDLEDRFAALAHRTAATHLAVVHGDVSPKNILVGPDGPVLLDAECAWFGDPAVDVAFCINHLLIKSVKLPSKAVAFRSAGFALAAAHAAHVHWESPAALMDRVISLLPAFALARVDGRSPVEYLSEPQRDTVRGIGRDLLATPALAFDELLDQWATVTGRLAASLS
jgi:tRNA A-37 threonylcarbamoyl transferase component Bud32